MKIETKKKLDYLEETKDLIRSAIEAKGQSIADSDTFRSYADKISSIESAAEPVLQDKEVTENGSYSADEGFDGLGTVTVDVVGSSEELRYVTFKNHDGTVEYGKKAVAVGDDCADPIARGIFATPTRESDAQYNYTFYGWATEPNGAADANALKAVEEDKTVYANFASAVRYYTITYYDEDGTTVLKTESLAYGAMPSYKPIKEGFQLSGWVPSAIAVTGDASYTAQWEEITDRLIFLSRATTSELIDRFAVSNAGQNIFAVPNGSKNYVWNYKTTSEVATQSKKTTTTNGYAMGGVALNYSDTKAYLFKYSGTAFNEMYLNTIPFYGSASASYLGNVNCIACSPSTELYCYHKTNSNNSHSLVFSNGNSVTIPESMKGMEITKNDKYALYYVYAGKIVVVDISEKKIAATINSNVTAAEFIDISADGTKCVISGGGGVFAEVYSLETFEKICDFSNILTANTYAAFADDLLVIASGSTVRAFEIVDSMPVEYFGIPVYSGGTVKRIDSSHNKNYVAIYDGTNIELWGKA